MTDKYIAIKSLCEHRIKKFEKEIRRYFSRQPEFQIEDNGQIITSSTYHIYLFKNVLDNIYSSGDHTEFPIELFFIYGNMFTHRNIKTDIYIPHGEDDIESINFIIDNHECLVLWVYDEKFPHKPENPFLRVTCAVNTKKRLIVPMQFSDNLSHVYPKWFEGKLIQDVRPEVGVDFNLIERIKEAMS
jgi:hypothetical protein